MRSLLILIIVVCLGASISAVMRMMNSNEPQSTQLTSIFMLVSVLILNAWSAYYLYKKAQSKKIEWALFGFLGNLNAILFYYCKNYLTERWGKGKSIFRD